MKPIAITMGDPAGIGPEIVLKLARDVGQKIPLVVLGDIGVLQRTATELGLKIPIAEIKKVESVTGATKELNVIPVTELKSDLARAQVSAIAGQAAFEYVARAIELAMAGAIDAIVTAPLNKEALRLAGLAYPGHTEILAELSHTNDYTMMMASDDLRVVLVTIHEALRQAITHVDQPSILRVIRLADRALRQAGIAAPRIGVAGLNPHAGENGLMGSEEIEIIGPAVKQARGEGIDATGPYPPDTVFLRARNGDFDVVIAQYHDQGLIPFKYLGLDKGVNVTIGLPFVRTSVDHGTAFDIVGKGVADHRSLLVALDQALQMIGEPALAVSA
ncbi:4-hydroxythreonine-4-phosphate dehydrogenase PdxA [Mycobacteroides chelonae]|uniref:4-hydroxythreonine-4-phosphate dehydrogenase PdxA n=1 Tax=Mycobacteroides chelonae TaxID=1774 RepID=UPI0008AA347B|nr:4-hydroxythreonine-4-phosphate dehydrogenase PdxA [Mycobacteroides chelonae]OHU64970.1 4-hydroxythreonine-4-phosphate dehydrogenase PdxA [Mycobacteroides chelonae]